MIAGEAASRSCTIESPRELPSESALLVPTVASALRAWDLLRLEVGAAAVVTPGPEAALLAAVARWYGAKPLVLGAGTTGAIHPAGADAVGSLTGMLTSYPSVCAVELTGRADVVDLLLESVPKYSRVLFAGPRGDCLTIDYYLNVHRKGLQLSSTVLSALDAFDSPSARALAQRASRLLANPVRAAEASAAVRSQPELSAYS